METRVQQIHRAVDTASEVLLQDMPYDAELAKHLKSIGFTAAEQVLDYDDHRLSNDKARYYKLRYPGYKFITEHQLKKVQDKYGLIEGPLSRFKGAIPQKNITDMLRFQMFKTDLSDERVLAAGFATGMNRRQVADEFSRLQKQPLRNRVGRSWSAQFIEYASHDHYHRPDDQKISFAEINERFPGLITITADRELFLAPDPELDPIVSVAVKGGLLVITAWGDEANDPDIMNFQMN